MLRAFCLHKITFVIITVTISSCIKFSCQQRQSEFPFGQLNQLKLTDQNNANSQSSSYTNKKWLNAGEELVFVTTTVAPLKKSVYLKPGQELVFVTTTSRPLEKYIDLKHNHELIFVTTTAAPLKKSVDLRPGQELVFVTTTSRPLEKYIDLKHNHELIFVTTTAAPLKKSVDLRPGQELIFITTTSSPLNKFGQELIFVTTTSATRKKSVDLKPGQELIFVTTTSRPLLNSVVYVNNQRSVPTMVPFMRAATTPTPEFLSCFRNCPTTSEFNPICASNHQLYINEQKFNCARHCGADIKIVRRGSC